MLALFPILVFAGAVELTGPGRVTGDPGAPVALSLEVDVATRVAKITLAADAGTLGTPRELAPTRFAVDFTPPRVAVPTAVTVTATLPGGERASWVMTVDPLDDERADLVSAGTLAIRGPGRVVLGPGGAAKIFVRSATPDPPTLMASVGTLSTPVPDGSGGYELLFTPPESGPPRVAVIAAWSGRETDWLAIPLAGNAKVDVATDRRAAVMVHAGDRSYGPFRSIPGKSIVVPVVVPVGLTQCTFTAVDASGNTTSKNIPLGVPSARGAHVFAAPDASRILVVAIAEDGSADPAVTPVIEVSSGRVTETKEGALGGATVWEYLPAPDSRPGDGVDVEVRAGASLSRTSMRLPSAEPSALTVSVDPAIWSPGGRPVQVTVSLEGTGPFAEAPVEFAASAGNVSPPVFAGRRVSAEWIPADTLPESRSATLTVRRGALSATTVLALQSGPVARLELLPERDVVRGDGETETRVRVVALDAAGNTAGPEGIELSASGTLSPLQPEPDGSWTAIYRPRRSERRGEDTITVSAGETRADATIEVLPAWAALTVGASAGFVSNFGRVSAPVASIELHAAVPRISSAGVSLGAGFYRSRSHVPLAEIGESAELELDVVPVTLHATYRRRLGSRLDGYAGGGVGAFLARVAVRSPSAGERTSDASSLGASFLAGIETGRARARLFFEVGYWEARASGSVHGNIGGARAAAGYRYAF